MFMEYLNSGHLLWAQNVTDGEKSSLNPGLPVTCRNRRKKSFVLESWQTKKFTNLYKNYTIQLIRALYCDMCGGESEQTPYWKVGI